jgi:hypothetical protein
VNVQELINDYQERLKPYQELDKKRLSRLNQNITRNDIDTYNQLFLEILNSIYDNFKVNDYFVLDKFLYIIYDYHSPEKLAIDEIIKALGDSEAYIGYKNKIILKGENILSNVLPSQAFKDACKVCKKLFEMGY